MKLHIVKIINEKLKKLNIPISYSHKLLIIESMNFAEENKKRALLLISFIFVDYII